MSTTEFWIADAEGRVLGPVGLEVLKDLILAGRLGSVAKVSRDGKSWAPLQSVPELLAIVEQRDPSVRTAREKAQAARLRSQLDAMRSRPAHEIFKLPPDATLEQHREAFFRLSKQFHPDAVPADAVPELRDACALAFRFLSGLMTRVESGLNRAPPPPPPPPPVALETPVPSYDPESFVGIKQLGPGAAQAKIRVTAANVGMFTDHPLMNLRCGACFVITEQVLPLGTQVALTLSFEDPPYAIVARAKVAFEDAGRGKSAHGFGITLLDLPAKDREFIKGFVERMKQQRQLSQAS
jgi:Tfp pilus assembly protein PilZ